MPQSHVQREAMEISGKALVRRWGGRAVGLAVTGIGLYVVAPSLLTMFGAWPRLADVEVRWFAVLAALGHQKKGAGAFGHRLEEFGVLDVLLGQGRQLLAVFQQSLEPQRLGRGLKQRDDALELFRQGRGVGHAATVPPVPGALW